MEKLTYVRRRPQGGVPEITDIPIHETGSVWDREWSAFMVVIEPCSSVKADFSDPASAADGLEVLKIVDRLYDCASRVAPQDAVVG